MLNDVEPGALESGFAVDSAHVLTRIFFSRLNSDGSFSPLGQDLILPVGAFFNFFHFAMIRNLRQVVVPLGMCFMRGRDIGLEGRICESGLTVAGDAL